MTSTSAHVSVLELPPATSFVGSGVWLPCVGGASAKLPIVGITKPDRRSRGRYPSTGRATVRTMAPNPPAVGRLAKEAPKRKSPLAESLEQSGASGAPAGA